jgi:phage-related baseplate assembly protein
MNLPKPNFIEVLNYEEIVSRKTSKVQSILAEKGIAWIPNESDDLMTMIEADAYDEILLRGAINDRIKQQYLAYAQGTNLDAVATKYFDERIQGSKPTAIFKFVLTEAKNFNVTIQAGMLLGDGGVFTAQLLADVVILAGQLSATGRCELNSYVEQSDIVTSTIVTPVPYLASVEQLEPFFGGASEEDDDSFRERVWMGREKKTTAGSRNMYKYYALQSDSRITAVNVSNNTNNGIVEVTIAFADGEADDVAINRVMERLNDDETRPLSDRIEVKSVVVTTVVINATVTLTDLSFQDSVHEYLLARMAANSLVFGRTLTLAKLYSLFDNDFIADVNIASPVGGIAVADDAMCKIVLEALYVV